MNPSTDAQRVIYVAANAQQAQLLAGALEEEGITAFVSNAALQTALGGVPPGFDTAPRVLVDGVHAARAREIALEFERRLRQSRRDVAPARAWYQFTIRGLLFLTACVAIYFGVDRLLGAPIWPTQNGNVPMAAVVLFGLGALYFAFRRKRRSERG
jgi:Putative prokaryotic signal transducing protein